MMLTAAERETNIQWSDADKRARIYTCQRRMQAKLAKHPRARLVKQYTDENGNVTGEYWKLPIRCIRIIPGKKRELSEAQREAARQRMRAMRRVTVPADRSVP